MTMPIEHVPTETGIRSGAPADAAGDEINAIDPRLPPEAPRLMTAQRLHPEGEGLIAWLRGLFSPFGQAG